jgi:hypothetical protein
MADHSSGNPPRDSNVKTPGIQSQGGGFWSLPGTTWLWVNPPVAAVRVNKKKPCQDQTSSLAGSFLETETPSLKEMTNCHLAEGLELTNLST